MAKQLPEEISRLLRIEGGNLLHIGGWETKPGWKILNIQQRDGVDYPGDIRDLSQFPDASFDVVYASHVLEHVSYQNALLQALGGIHRILRGGGRFLVSVPDMDVLTRMFLHEQSSKHDRFHIMRMMFGGQTDEHDFHYVGLNAEFLADYLSSAGFRELYRVPEFNIFQDASSLRYRGALISLNLIAVK